MHELAAPFLSLAVLAVSPPAREDALAVLDRAARFQRGAAPLEAPRSLHVRFHVEVYDAQGNVSADVERWYERDPERLLTSREERVSGSRSTVGYDDGAAWFRDDDSGRVVVYSEQPENFDVDLRQLDDQLRLTRLLLDSAVVDALRPRLQDLVLAGPGEVRDVDDALHAVDLLRARIVDDLYPPPGEAPPSPSGTVAREEQDPPTSAAGERLVELLLTIDRETGALWAVRLTPLGRNDVPVIDLVFDLHGESADGLRLPGNIRVRETWPAGEPREVAKLGVVADEQDRLVFELDPELDPDLFRIPAGD